MPQACKCTPTRPHAVTALAASPFPKEDITILKPSQRVGVRPPPPALHHRLNPRRALNSLSQPPKHLQRLARIHHLIHNADHPALTMPPLVLRTVKPNRLRIPHLNLKDLARLRDAAVGVLGHGEEARVEGRRVLGHAGRGEGGFDDGVVGREEVEFHDGAGLGEDVFWVEAQAGAAGDHGVGRARRGGLGAGWGGGGEGQGGEEGEEDGGGDHYVFLWV